MRQTLLRIWRAMPSWLHFLASKMVRAKFRAAVAALVFDEQGRILLFKHTYRKWQWGIPAGSLEYHEQPADAMVREFFEEAGLQLRIEKLLTIISAKEDNHLTVVYLGKVAGGEFRESNEVCEMKFFDVTDLPKMLFYEKALIKQVASGKIP